MGTIDGKPGKRIVYVNGNCTVSPDDGKGFLEDPATGHIRNVSTLLSFGAEYNEHYQGQRHVRGIPCDHWVSHIYRQEIRGGHTIDVNITVHYYFADPAWNMLGHITENHRVPGNNE